MYVREHILEQLYNKVTMHTCLRIRGLRKVCIPVTECDAYLRLLHCTENGIAWHGFGNYIPM